MKKIRGQIQIGLVAALGALIIAAVGLAYNATVKADKAIDKASSVEGDVKAIKSDVVWIREYMVSQQEKELLIKNKK